jgi:hypothetical protein
MCDSVARRRRSLFFCCGCREDILPEILTFKQNPCSSHAADIFHKSASGQRQARKIKLPNLTIQAVTASLSQVFSLVRIRQVSETYQDITMITQVMVQPSSWVESGIKISKVRNLNLFKFTDELQSRLDELSEKKKADFLSSEEEAELTGILELDRIFTLLNARIIAES